MSRTKIVSFIGAGALASGLATLLRGQGYSIGEIVARPAAPSLGRARMLARRLQASAVTLPKAGLNCDVLWLAVPDSAIAQVAESLRDREALPKVVLHPSGALSSDVLAPLALRGVHIASAHPMMTFVAGSAPSLQGAWFAVEGAPVAVRAARAMARSLGANSFTLPHGSKALYHSFGAMLSPMLAAELEAAEQVGLRAGVPASQLRSIMEPIVLRTVSNILRNGAGKSFSGPLARGDVGTVAAHLDALAGSPELPLYRALVEYAVHALPVKRPDEMKKLLRQRRRSRV